MPAKSKIEDEGEALRWIEEGHTYAWMAKEHAEKYGVRLSPTTFSELRKRHGMPRRAARDVDLLPWAIRREHRKGYILGLLRAEARLRAGMAVSEVEAGKVEGFKSRLARDNRVIHYEPETERGWYLVPRREGIDTDIIRRPDKRSNIRGVRD